jgi:hypothetical protein
MISEQAIADLKARNPVEAVAGVRLRRNGRKLIGPCPICSPDPQSRDATRFEVTNGGEGWVCAACQQGGDVIRLVQLRDGVDFPRAVDILGGADEREPTEADARRAGHRAHEAGAGREVPAAWGRFARAFLEGYEAAAGKAATIAAREARELQRLLIFWRERRPVEGGPVAAYHAARGLSGMSTGALGWHARMPYWFEPRPGAKPEILFVGDAQLAPILDWPAGRFIGLHATFIDVDRPGEKREIVHPETGELLPPKKVRGNKKGGFIPLTAIRGRRRLVAGEGIETTGSAEVALQAVGAADGVGFMAGVDLGNLAGRASGSVPHPTQTVTTPKGEVRPRFVPGPEPDLTSDAMPVPEEVEDLVVIKDGDSEPFATDMAMRRFAARHARPGRSIRIVDPGAPVDLNDLLRGQGAWR